MKLSYYLCLLVLVFSCSKESEPEPLPMTITTQSAVVLSSTKVKVRALINNFLAKNVVEVGFIIEDNYGSRVKEVKIASPGTAEFEMEIDGLEAITQYKAKAVFYELSSSGNSTYTRYSEVLKSFETDLPVATGATPNSGKVTDFATFKVTGEGFNDNTYFYFGSKPSAAASIQYVPFVQISRTATEYEGRLPVIGARGKDIPTFYEGAIQPSALYMGNESKTKITKICDLDYTYLFSIPSTPVTAGSTFIVTAYYGRPTPNVDNVEVYLGSTKLTILERKYVFDVAIGNQSIEGHQLKCQLPAGVTGTFEVKVLSPFGEQFKANAIGNQLVIN